MKAIAALVSKQKNIPPPHFTTKETNLFADINLGSVLFPPKFIFTDADGHEVIKSDTELITPFNAPVKFFISITKIVKSGRYFFMVEDAKELDGKCSINWDSKDPYTKARFSAGRL